jgi:hypothetical protein
MAPLAIRIMDGSASIVEQQDYAQRLVAAGERLRQRIDETDHPVVDGEVFAHGLLGLVKHAVEPYWES